MKEMLHFVLLTVIPLLFIWSLTSRHESDDEGVEEGVEEQKEHTLTLLPGQRSCETIQKPVARQYKSQFRG